MNYRLTRKELRVIEETKKEGGATSGDREGQAIPKTGTAAKIRPYIYFAVIFIILAIAVKLLIYFTS